MDNMKKETKLNVRLKAMLFDEAICEAEHNSSGTDTAKSSSNDGNLHIFRKKLNNFETFLIIFLYLC